MGGSKWRGEDVLEKGRGGRVLDGGVRICKRKGCVCIRRGGRGGQKGMWKTDMMRLCWVREKK